MTTGAGGVREEARQASAGVPEAAGGARGRDRATDGGAQAAAASGAYKVSDVRPLLASPMFFCR